MWISGEWAPGGSSKGMDPDVSRRNGFIPHPWRNALDALCVGGMKTAHGSLLSDIDKKTIVGPLHQAEDSQ